MQTIYKRQLPNNSKQRYDYNPPHRSCKPKEPAFFLRVIPYYEGSYGFEVDEDKFDIVYDVDIVDQIQEYVKSKYDTEFQCNIISKINYEYIVFIIKDKKSAETIMQLLHNKRRNKYTMKCDIIEGSVDVE